MGIEKHGAPLCKAVDIWGVGLWVATETADPVVLVIDGDHQNVWGRAAGIGCWTRRGSERSCGGGAAGCQRGEEVEDEAGRCQGQHGAAPGPGGGSICAMVVKSGRRYDAGQDGRVQTLRGQIGSGNLPPGAAR